MRNRVTGDPADRDSVLECASALALFCSHTTIILNPAHLSAIPY